MVAAAVVGLAAVFLFGKSGIDSGMANFNDTVDERVPRLIELEKLLIRSVQLQGDIREMILATEPAHRENVEKRIQQHQRGETKSLKNKGPFDIIRVEEFATRSQAYQRERQIKSYKGGQAFKSLY